MGMDLDGRISLSFSSFFWLYADKVNEGKSTSSSSGYEQLSIVLCILRILAIFSFNGSIGGRGGKSSVLRIGLKGREGDLFFAFFLSLLGLFDLPFLSFLGFSGSSSMTGAVTGRSGGSGSTRPTSFASSYWGVSLLFSLYALFSNFSLSQTLESPIRFLIDPGFVIGPSFDLVMYFIIKFILLLILVEPIFLPGLHFHQSV